MSYEPQVDRAHYEGKAYRSAERWSSYYHQLALVRGAGARSVLEVGVGEGTVARTLRAEGVEVTTVDIAGDLQPDLVGSVTALPCQDKSFDVALAAEVLEHIQWEDVPAALGELARASRSHVVIGLPHPGYAFSFVAKVPLLPRIELYLQLPFFWQTHRFNGQHYWELGKQGHSISSFVRLAKEAGLTLERLEKHADDPAHRFFLFSVQS